MADNMFPARVPASDTPPLVPINTRPTPADYASEPVEPAGWSLADILGALRRQRWLIFGITVLTFAATVYVVRREVPRYRAGAMVRLVNARAALAGNLADGAPAGLAGTYTDPLQSQILVLKGRGVLGEVVDRVGLRVRPISEGFGAGQLENVQVSVPPAATDTMRLSFGPDGATAQAGAVRAEAAYGAPLTVGGVQLTVPRRPEVDEATLAVIPRDDAIDHVEQALDARPRQGTDGIDLTYTSPDRELAIRAVNAAAEAFQNANARSAQQQAVRRRIFLQQRIRDADSMLAVAQSALSRFRSGQQLYSSGAQLSAQQGEMMQLEMRREEMDAERQLYQSLLSQLTQSRAATQASEVRALMSAPGIAANPAISQLFGQLVQYQTQLDSLTTGPNRKSETNPDVERLRSLLESTQERLASAVQGHVATLEARVRALDQMRARSGSQMQRLPDAEAEELRLTQQVELAQQTGAELRTEFQKARLTEAVEAGEIEVVNLAARANQIPLNRPLKYTLGLVLGLLLGTSGALLREATNQSIRRREDIESLLRIPGLGVIPQIASTGGSGKRKRLRGDVQAAAAVRGAGTALVAASQLRSPGAEAYRTLRTNLVFSQAVHQLKTLVVTSASASEGKSTTAANLAVTFAQQSFRVLVVDCDLRRPSMHSVMGVPREPGLTNALLEQEGLQAAIRPTAVENLEVLPAGILPPNPHELLAGDRMKNMLQILSARYDMVIVDTPPLLAASDAAVLGASADGVLLVVRASQTERSAAQHAAQQLRGVGARLVGAVLNDPDAKVDEYGGDYYMYTYDYYGAEK